MRTLFGCIALLLCLLVLLIDIPGADLKMRVRGRPVLCRLAGLFPDHKNSTVVCRRS